jgi:hypothetical protein
MNVEIVRATGSKCVVRYWGRDLRNDRLTTEWGPGVTLSYGTKSKSWLESEDCRRRDLFLPKIVSI